MRQTTLSWKASPLQIQKNKLVRIIRAVIDTKIGQYLAAKIFTEINSKRYSYKNYRCNYRGFSTLEGSFFKYRSGISKPLQEKRRKFDAWAAYRRQKSYEHLSKRQYAFKVDAFASIFDTWFDTQYLTGPDVCLWTRSKDHEQPFSIFPFVIVDRLSYLIILRAAGCARKREGEKGSKSGAGFFFDEIMASELSFSFFDFFHSNPHPFDLHFSRMERNLLQLLPLSRIWNMEYSLNFE